LLDPTSGRAVIAGKDVTGDKDAIKQVVGYLPDNFGVYPTLRVWEYLDFFAAAYRIPKKDRKARTRADAAAAARAGRPGQGGAVVSSCLL
jgi:ABC-type multidrug transport system ATPase subunit